ncbi:hypothetical protein CYY_007786 [Polysphondylium violaceum]|uniref:AB hydrolase-1 domain-containing protein n=1 Tax=Polysphondylium violaceum TaxID=133409 RepID=A0A8J4PN55_9MYCE|nr:hypothetical protein CYY_007786 [Polysphondylium violaceum]
MFKRESGEVKLYFDPSNKDTLSRLEKCPHLYQQSEFKVTDADRINDINESEPTIKNGVSLYPPWMMYNSHYMNYYAAFAIPKLNLKSTREILVNPNDGGTVSLDWFDLGEYSEDCPTVLVCHGLTGGSHERYIQYFAKHSYKEQGFRTVVLNYRGCAGNQVTADIGYCATQIEDLKMAVKHVTEKLPKVEKWFLLGFSLGASIVVNYLNDAGDSSPFVAHASISNPMNMVECTKNLKATYLNNYLYNQGLAKNIKKLFSKWGDGIYKYATKEEIAAAKTIYDLDTLVTHKMFGYKSATHYYEEASSSRNIQNLKKPILFINASDDPIAPVIGFPFYKFKHNPNTILAVSRWGAHLGFIDQKDHQSWADKAVTEYFTSFL